MSSTKIVIIVLVLVAVIFVIFVLTGAFSSESKSKNSKDQAKDFLNKPPGWTKTIKGFIGSRQPKIPLKPNYSNATVKILSDSKNPIRTATFRLVSGSAIVKYNDETENAGDLEEQECPLPNFDNKDDIRVCSIVALKDGGTLKITCGGTAGGGTAGCLVKVEQ